MGVEDLREAYMEAMMDDPALGLEGFLRQVAEGRHGAQAPDEIRAFLHSVERDIVGSIHTKAGASPGAAQDAERLIDERREEIANLIERYAREKR